MGRARALPSIISDALPHITLSATETIDSQPCHGEFNPYRVHRAAVCEITDPIGPRTMPNRGTIRSRDRFQRFFPPFFQHFSPLKAESATVDRPKKYVLRQMILVTVCSALPLFFLFFLFFFIPFAPILSVPIVFSFLFFRRYFDSRTVTYNAVRLICTTDCICSLLVLYARSTAAAQTRAFSAVRVARTSAPAIKK